MINRAAIGVLLPAYESQGVTSVFVVACCNRVYVGKERATKCRTCANTPVNHEVRTDGSNLNDLPEG